MGGRPADLERARELLIWFRAHLERLHGPARVHPDTGDIAAAVREWAEEFHIADGAAPGGHRLDQSMLVPCYVMPDAPVEVVGILARYYAWLAAVNDELIYADVTIEAFTDAVDGVMRRGEPPEGAHRLVRAVADIRERVLRLDASLVPGFARGVLGILGAWCRRRHWVRTGRLPSLAEYLDYRALCLAIDEASLLQRLQPDLLDPHEPYTYGLARISAATGLLTSLVNDLISYPMEIRRGEEFTLFRVLAQEYGIRPEQTFPCALALVSAVHHDLGALVTALHADARVGATERRQADALLAWVDGTYRWHLAGTRYDFADTDGPDAGALRYPVPS
ncbi:terpene synthase family protein [Streptomyces sp. CA-249302]|uniref:terpene synthase family protein n=1 Tax=Streptomyces sp. CA-249302 TaxID=3240058 RepID=UPI003D8C356B